MTEMMPLRRPGNPKPPIIHLSSYLEEHAEVKINESGDDSDLIRFVPTDFNPQKSALSNRKPWSVETLIPPILQFYLNDLSDVQFPTLLILYLQPLFPSLFEYNHSVSVLLAYYEHLVSLCLFVQAVSLRKACYPTYPEIRDRGRSNSQAPGYFCTTCNKPVKGDTMGYCERCKKYWGLCPICETYNTPLRLSSDSTTDAFGYQVPFPNGADTLWRWCQECGHGGHVGCLKVWWEDEELSEGACPLQGCTCDCVPGKRRNERLKHIEIEKRKRKQEGGGIIRDGWVVGESKAVEMARGVLGGPANGSLSGSGLPRGLSGRSGALSAGLAGGKKVRLVVPDQVEAHGPVQVEQTEPKDEETSRSVP